MADVIELSSDDECGASNSNPQLPIVLKDWNQPSTSSAPTTYNQSSNSTLHNKTFKQVIDTCQQFVHKNDTAIIIGLQKLYSKLDEKTKDNESFKSLMTEIDSKIKGNPNKIFVYIKELADEIKLCIRMSQEKNNCEEKNINVIAKSKSNDVEKTRRKHEIRVRRLEKLLRLLSRKIQKLEEKELSLDEMDKEDSIHLIEDRYKKRLVQVWKKLCELNKCSESTGRCMEKIFNYKGSRYHEINKKVSKYINKYKEVPEYPDILELVEKVNSEYNLLVDAAEEARKVFTEVVEILRGRRLMDFQEKFYIIEDTVDPADHDAELAKSLDESRKKRIQKTDEVINEFVQKQSALEKKNRMGAKQNEQNGADKEEDDEEEEDEKENNNDTTKTKTELDEESFDDDDEDEETENEKCDIQKISEEFENELETEEPMEENVIDSETEEDDSDLSDDETEREDNPSPDPVDELPNSLKTFSITNNSLKRPPESLPEETLNCKRPHLSQTPIEDDDDVIVLD